jgi:hypothetical protein
MVDIPISRQFEIVKSQNAILDYAAPRYMSAEHFTKTYRCAPSEIEILGIHGKQFVDLESTKAKLLILRAKFR